MSHLDVYLAAGALAGMAGAFHAFSGYGAHLFAQRAGLGPFAAGWRDEFVDAPMDASWVNYVATANDLTAIDEAILSRFDVFEIPDPEPEEARRIAASVYREVLRREGWGDLFDPELDADVLDRLAAGTPREARILLGQALPKACAKGRDRLRIEDFKSPAPARRTIGFY